MIALCRQGACVLAGLAGAIWLTLPVLAAGTAVPAVSEPPIIDITFGQIMLFFTNLGLGAVFLYFLLKKDARATKLEELVNRTDATEKATAAMFKTAMENMTQAFEQINDRNLGAFEEAMQNYRDLSKEMNQIMAGNIQVQTQLAERLRERTV